MELDCETERSGGVTLVTLRLSNERATDRRVRVTNRLDGPVLPPRRNREPEAGWDRDGVTTVVPAGGERALGYACPAAADSSPATVEWVGDADGTERGSLVSGAMRRLGDPRPPRMVMTDGSESAAEADDTDAQPPGRTMPTTRVAGGGRRERSPPPTADVSLQSYRRRIETVEALGAADVPTAADILETDGGLAGAEADSRALDEDAATLRALAAEAWALAARAEAATPPVEALRRLS